MITKRTIIDQIEWTNNGSLHIRLARRIEEDGNILAESGFHRTSVGVGGDPLAQMAAVNAHLESMGQAPVEAADIAKIAAVHAAMATLEQSAAYKAALAAAGRRP